MSASLSTKRLSRPDLRKLLNELLVIATELDAFCLDYFASVYKNFSNGMDRQARVNLLLAAASTTDIWKALLNRFGPSELDARMQRTTTQPRSDEEDILQEQRSEILQDQLDELQEQRADCIANELSTHELDAQIVAIKRQKRSLRSKLKEGSVLNDHYRLIEIIGRGGYANVWRAFDQSTRQIVAIKVLHGDQAEDLGRLERMRRGAEQMRDLNHISIVRVLHGPVQEGGIYYVVMAYIAGSDLHRAVIEQRIDQQIAVKAVLDVGQALEYAHSRGVIHRDVKPQNILLDKAGRAYLTDFDLAHAANSTGGTRTGAMVGTYLYAAPEAMEDGSEVDCRADIYSLGMTLLFVLCGKQLTTRLLLNRIEFIRSLNYPESIRNLLRSATAVEEEIRPQSMKQFCTRLTNCWADAIRVSSAHLKAINSMQAPHVSISKKNDMLSGTEVATSAAESLKISAVTSETETATSAEGPLEISAVTSKTETATNAAGPLEISAVTSETETATSAEGPLEISAVTSETETATSAAGPLEISAITSENERDMKFKISQSILRQQLEEALQKGKSAIQGPSASSFAFVEIPLQPAAQSNFYIEKTDISTPQDPHHDSQDTPIVHSADSILNSQKLVLQKLVLAAAIGFFIVSILLLSLLLAH